MQILPNPPLLKEGARAVALLSFQLLIKAQHSLPLRKRGIEGDFLQEVRV
jgi:hypothetical protein